MTVIPRLLFVLVLVVAPIMIWATSAALPAQVASHFGAGGRANGWMTHDAYVALMLVLVTVLPVLVAACTGFVPRFATSRGMIAARDYWLAPARRAATLEWLASHACWMGILLALFLTGMHLLVVAAHEVAPPRLREPAFFVLLSGFGVLMCLWMALLRRHFRHPG
jgi:uncharacterized membrane protein